MKLFYNPLRLIPSAFTLLTLVNCAIGAFAEGVMDGYERANRTSDGLVTIHCHCGEVWTQRRPAHYAGHAGYPQSCPNCDGMGIDKTPG